MNFDPSLSGFHISSVGFLFDIVNLEAIYCCPCANLPVFGWSRGGVRLSPPFTRIGATARLNYSQSNS